MASFDTIYTGKGLAASFPSDGGKAMNRLSDFIVKAEEIKYNAFKETQNWFLKSQDVDPVMFLTTANQIAQDKLLKNYNEASAAILKASNNNLSTEDRAKIIAGKNVLISEQNKMKSDMGQALLEREMVEKDNGVNYDPQEWLRDKWQPYIETGKYNTTPLQLKARPIEDVFKGKVTGASAYEEPDPGNPTRLRVMSADRKTVAPRIVETIFTNDRVKRHALQEWVDRTPEDKERFYDQNNDSIITEEERRQGDVLTKSLDNPIIKAYVDKHWGNLVDVKFVNKQKISTGTTAVAKGTPTKVAGTIVNIFPGEKATGRTYGGNVYSNDSFSFGGNTTLYGIPTAGAKLLTGSWTDNVDPGSVNGRLVLYDPQKRVFLIETSSASGSAETATKVLLEVPESSISNAGNVPIIVDGKQTTIGDYLKNIPAKTGGILD